MMMDTHASSHASAATIAHGLGGTWSNSTLHGRAKCPAHADTNASLEIDESTDGQALVWCAAGCSQSDVIAKLVSLGLWRNGDDADHQPSRKPNGSGKADVQPIIPVPPDAPPMKFKHPELGTPNARWAYHDITGMLVCYVCRWNIGGDKKFLPVTFCDLGNGNFGWRSKGVPGRRPLYRLPRIIKRTDVPILVTEGEKSADAAQLLFQDYAATTSMHGAGSPGKTDWSSVSGRHVAIWPDNDAAGQAYAETVKGLCEAAGAMSVRIVELPEGLPNGWDLADQLPDGISAADLLECLGEKAGGSNERRTRNRKKGNDAVRGDLARAVDIIADEYPQLRFDLLNGIVEGDVSAAQARLHIETKTGNTPRRDIVADAIEIVARNRAYDPLLEHINSLPRWDGKARIGEPGVPDATGWLSTYAGAEDTDYCRAIGRKFLIGATARAKRPGCKMDCLLSLIGRQGTQKSSLFEVIGGPFYKSNLNVSDLHGKESRQEIRGSWVVEFPELSTLRKSDFDSAKGFLSEKVDKYRASYGRHPISVPRRSVFGGTINKDKPFISDTETQRRLWILTVSRVLIAALTADRDQLLAEAIVYLDREEPWWFDDADDTELESLLDEAQAPHRLNDPWMPLFDDYLQKTNPKEIHISAVLQAIGLPLASVDKRAEMRGADILRELGWIKGAQRRVNGVRAVWWSKVES